MQHVRQQQREGLVADDLARAPDGVSEAERRLLAREARLPGVREVALQHFERVLLAALRKRALQFVLAVEMVLDDALVAAGDENEMLDAGRARLVDDVLDARAGRRRSAFPSGMALVAGRNRVPSPATGKTALRTRFGLAVIHISTRLRQELNNARRGIGHAKFVTGQLLVSAPP